MKRTKDLSIVGLAGLLGACSMSSDEGKGLGFGEGGVESVGDSGGADDGSDDGGSDDGGDDEGDTEGADEDGGDDMPGEVCGNGVLDSNEACDGTEFADSCQSLGWESGELACDSSCKMDATACFTCGNGTLEGPETCDGEVPGFATCESEGFTEGEVTCNVDTCELDTATCTLCGDDVREGNEECDGPELDGNTCDGLGYESGDLTCAADTCTLDTTSCAAFEYEEDFEGGSFGTAWNNGGNMDWTITDTDTIEGGFTAKSGQILDYAQSTLGITLEFTTDGQLSFSHRESTELNYDYLYFYIDSEEQAKWSGITTNTPETFDVEAGMHTFLWVYQKDAMTIAGEDTVWIDSIHAVGGKLP